MDIFTLFTKNLKAYLEKDLVADRIQKVIANGVYAYAKELTVSSQPKTSLQDIVKIIGEKFPSHKNIVTIVYFYTKVEESREILHSEILPSLTQSNIKEILDQVKILMIG